MQYLTAPRSRVVVFGALLLLAASEGVLGDETLCSKFDASTLQGSNPKDFCQFQIDSGTPPKQGDVCLAHPEDVFPTQAAFGEVDASCAQKELEELAAKKDGSLRAQLMSKQAPGILGPRGKMYITDHHHLSRAMLSAFLPYAMPMHHRTLFVCVTQVCKALV